MAGGMWQLVAGLPYQNYNWDPKIAHNIIIPAYCWNLALLTMLLRKKIIAAMNIVIVYVHLIDDHTVVVR